MLLWQAACMDLEVERFGWSDCVVLVMRHLLMSVVIQDLVLQAVIMSRMLALTAE